MRWRLGDYDLKYNPKTSGKSWDAQQSVKINANGEISNPNLVFNGSHNFSIDVYEPPTKATSTTVTGAYIALSEKRTNGRLYLLNNSGTFEVKDKNGGLLETHIIVSGNGVSLPSVNPNSLIHFDTGLAFIHKEATQSTLLITDENGVANRKYIYSAVDLDPFEYIAWDYDSSFLVLNPHGKIFRINTTTGSSSFLYQFSDFDSNVAKSQKKYTSIFVAQKGASMYIGVLKEGSNLLYIDYDTLEILCKSESKLLNLLYISYSNYSDEYYAIFGQNIVKILPNTARIDIEVLKQTLSFGQVTVYNEDNMPSILVVKDFTVNRKSNRNEARYEVSVNASIAYEKKGFGDKWSNGTRTI